MEVAGRIACRPWRCSSARRRRRPRRRDTILVNGHVVTVDARFSIAQAVAITGGKFTAVGTERRHQKARGSIDDDRSI